MKFHRREKFALWNLLYKTRQSFTLEVFQGQKLFFSVNAALLLLSIIPL